MKFDFKESRIIIVMAILLSNNIAQCDGRAVVTRAAIGWAWTGSNLILDEALIIVDEHARLITPGTLYTR